MKSLMRASLFLTTLPVCYIFVAVVLSLIPVNTESPECQKSHVVFVSSNGVHLDVIIPAESLSSTLREGLGPPPGVTHLAFGWGDKEFYINTPTWSDIKLGTALRALFVNSESAMHVVWTDRVYPNWTKVLLCDSQLQALMQFIESTFKRGSANELLEVEASGYTDRDKFYEAHGSFSCIQTCNHWVNKALKAAGTRTSVWSPLDKGVLYQLR